MISFKTFIKKGGEFLTIYCKICGKDFKESDSLIICAHKEGPIHLGCCVDGCSWDNQPCQHSHGMFEKID